MRTFPACSQHRAVRRLIAGIAALAGLAAFDTLAATADAPPATIDCAHVPPAELEAARRAGLCKPAAARLSGDKQKIKTEAVKPASPAAPTVTAPPPSFTFTPRPGKPPLPATNEPVTTPVPGFQPPTIVAVSPCAMPPKLPAQTVEAMRATYDPKRFRIVVSGEEPSTRPRGEILRRQAIAEGRVCIVKVVVSDGQLVVVPLVVGQRLDSVRARLAQSDLVLDAQSREDQGPAGLALTQQPEKGTPVRRGTQVRVVFSKPATLPTTAPPPPVAVNPCAMPPKLPAQTVEAMRAAYDPRRFRIVVSGEESSTRPRGEILQRQDIAEGRLCIVTVVVSDGQLVAVPPVVGQRLEPARERLAASDLVLDAQSRDDEGPAGLALTQQPERGTPVRRGTHVRVVFSRPAALAVPSVVGLLDEQARARLARFKVDARDASSDARRGEVVAQAPAAGQMAPPGSVVRIEVSLADLVRVPPVGQLAFAQARQALEDNGLAARVGTRAENDAAPDVVVAQQPAAGSLQPRNSVVTIDVSRGRPVPDVRQMSFEDARRQLARFDVRPSQTSLRDPIVVTQVPEAGSWAAAGSLVKLALDARPVPPPPPPPPAEKDASATPPPPVDKDLPRPQPVGPTPAPGEPQSLLMVALVAVLATLATLGTAAGALAGIRKWRDAKARGAKQAPVRIESRLDLRESTAQLDGGDAAGPLLRVEARLADARTEITIETEALHE